MSKSGRGRRLPKFLFFLIFACCLVNNVGTITIKNLRGRDPLGDIGFEYDLLNQTSNYKNNIFMAESNSDVLVKIAYRTFPRSFREFAIVASVQQNDSKGGYLFSILNPLGTVIQLGLTLFPVNRFINNITLIYTDAKLHVNSQSIATFQVPAFKEQTNIGIKVLMHKVTLYLNCHEVKSVLVSRDPFEIKTDLDSRLYVASAGPNWHGKFEGRIEVLKIFGDPETIVKICLSLLTPVETPQLFTESIAYYITIPATPNLESMPMFEAENDNISLTNTLDYYSFDPPKSNFYLRLAALNEPYSGNLHGTRGADFACYRQAIRAGVIGTFKAFLSTRIQSLLSLVNYPHWDIPIANIKGEMLFRSWKDLFDTNGELSHQSPRLYSLNGKDVLNDNTWVHKEIWHGSNINGDKSIESFCGTWESSAADKFAMAGSLSNNKLINNEKYVCKSKLIILCIETIPREELPTL